LSSAGNNFIKLSIVFFCFSVIFISDNINFLHFYPQLFIIHYSLVSAFMRLPRVA